MLKLRHSRASGNLGVLCWVPVFVGMTILGACSTTPPPSPIASGPVEVQILAINDFHGNLEPPNLTVPAANGAVPAGGAAYLASALKQARAARKAYL